MRLLLVLLPLGILLRQSLAQGQGVNLSEDAKKEIINTINNYRRQVKPTARNMLKAIWDQKASESAKKWAMTCKESASDVSVNRVVDGVYCGESISRSNFARSWSEVLAYWYKSGVNFTYGVEMKKPPFGYTQLIWDKSYRIGCAFTYCPKTTYPLFYICHYCPTGNLMNQITTPYKKGPPCGDCPNHCEDKLCTNPCKYQDVYSDCKSIVQQLGCTHNLVKEKCGASCYCKTEII